MILGAWSALMPVACEPVSEPRVIPAPPLRLEGGHDFHDAAAKDS